MDYRQYMPQDEMSQNIPLGNPLQTPEGIQIYNLVKRVQDNPRSYNPQQIMQIKQMALDYGIPFEVPSTPGRIMKNFAYGLGDSLTLGLLPESWRPDTVTDTESIAGTIGDILGFVSPMAVGGLAAKGTMGLLRNGLKEGGMVKTLLGGMKGAKEAGTVGKIAETGGKTMNALKKAMLNNEGLSTMTMAGAFAGGGHDILGGEIDPMGALVGGAIPFALGGGIGKGSSAFKEYMASKGKNVVPNTQIGQVSKNIVNDITPAVNTIDDTALGQAVRNTEQAAGSVAPAVVQTVAKESFPNLVRFQNLLKTIPEKQAMALTKEAEAFYAKGPQEFNAFLDHILKYANSLG